jgi:hypothetical protein
MLAKHLGIKLHYFIHWFVHNGNMDFHGLSADNDALGIIYPLQTLLGDAVIVSFYNCLLAVLCHDIELFPLDLQVLHCLAINLCSFTYRNLAGLACYNYFCDHNHPSAWHFLHVLWARRNVAQLLLRFQPYNKLSKYWCRFSSLSRCLCLLTSCF